MQVFGEIRLGFIPFDAVMLSPHMSRRLVWSTATEPGGDTLSIFEGFGDIFILSVILEEYITLPATIRDV